MALSTASAAQTASAAVSGGRAKAFVVRLAKLGPRVAGSRAEAQAARLVRDELKELGLSSAVQRVPLPSGGLSRNVVARTGSPIRVLLVAHLDSVSAGPGANDNGSGVAALLELARALREIPGVLFAWVGAEERVETGSRLHFGSARLVQSLGPRIRAGIELALTLDMVGYGTVLNVRGLEAEPNRSARLTLKQAKALALPASHLPDSGLSDHAELTRAGIPAALITWRWDTCWHKACDTAGHVRPWKIAAAARLALATTRLVLAG